MPAARIRAAVSGEVRTVRRADSAASESSGGTRRAAEPATSGRLAASEHTTGRPQAMASATGSPKPS